MLGECHTWHMDGTFKTCPEPFNQECKHRSNFYICITNTYGREVIFPYLWHCRLSFLEHFAGPKSGCFYFIPTQIRSWAEIIIDVSRSGSCLANNFGSYWILINNIAILLAVFLGQSLNVCCSHAKTVCLVSRIRIRIERFCLMGMSTFWIMIRSTASFDDTLQSDIGVRDPG
jgi:hypothetical protein